MKPYKLYKKWNTRYFPWLTDDTWQLEGNYETMEDCEKFLDSLLPTHAYMFKIEEPNLEVTEVIEE